MFEKLWMAFCAKMGWMSSTDNEIMPKIALPSENPPKTDNVAPPLPNSTPVAVSPAKNEGNPTLSDFLKWQWQFEGANPAINNPGNFRYFYGGYLPIYEPVGISKGGFAVFPTLFLGELYAINSTKNIIKNHPELTILTYLAGDGDWRGYAPVSDKGNNPPEYAHFIASHIGVTPSFLMKDLA